MPASVEVDYFTGDIGRAIQQEYECLDDFVELCPTPGRYLRQNSWADVSSDGAVAGGQDGA